MLPMIFFTGLSALISAVLNTRGHFAAPMWAPILNNLVVIGDRRPLHRRLRRARSSDPDADDHRAGSLLIGGGTLLGVAVQAAGLLPALRKVGFRWKWRFDFRALGLRELGRLGRLDVLLRRGQPGRPHRACSTCSTGPPARRARPAR